MTWNVPLLEQTFFPRDVEIIQQMPLSLRRPVDRFIWASTKKGVFTVKSAYQLQMAAQHSGEGSSSNSASSSSCIWRALWSTLVQPKVKVFMWWAWSNILPTDTKLFDKGISHSFSCQWCNDGVETLDHILWQFEFAQRTWSSSIVVMPSICTVSVFHGCGWSLFTDFS